MIWRLTDNDPKNVEIEEWSCYNLWRYHLRFLVWQSKTLSAVDFRTEILTRNKKQERWLLFGDFCLQFVLMKPSSMGVMPIVIFLLRNEMSVSCYREMILHVDRIRLTEPFWTAVIGFASTLCLFVLPFPC